MNTNYKEIKKCRCCKKENLIEILNLNNQPLANDYHDGSKTLDQYPLKLNLCSFCFNSQLSVSVNADLMFKNYFYVSGTSKTLNDYFEWFADFVTNLQNKKGNILDIACNDGTQLNKFKKLGWKTFGIDPANNLYNISKNNADQIICDYFSEKSIEQLIEKKFDAIIAQNVFAHVNDVDKFLELCFKIMKDDSRLYIQTSQADMIENNQFDTIYHEHLSFFSTKSIKILAKRFNFKLLSVLRTPIHGTSYVFILGKHGIEDDSVKKSEELEKNNRRYDLIKYDEYKNNVKCIIKKFKNTIEEYKNKGYLIVGYGAAAKGNTFLNAAGTKLHFIIDDNPNKHGLLLPGSNAYIDNKDIIKKLANDTLFVPLAWNFYKEIKENISSEVSKLPFKNNFKYEIYSYYPKMYIEKII